MTRNQQIKQLHRQNESLVYIAKKYNLSPERIRQIVYDLICSSKVFFTKSQYKAYKQKINILKEDQLLLEVKRLSKPNRQYELVQQRRVFIKLLRDKYKFTFDQIAFLLQRDRSSIIYLYYQTK